MGNPLQNLPKSMSGRILKVITIEKTGADAFRLSYLDDDLKTQRANVPSPLKPWARHIYQMKVDDPGLVIGRVEFGVRPTDGFTYAEQLLTDQELQLATDNWYKLPESQRLDLLVQLWSKESESH